MRKSERKSRYQNLLCVILFLTMLCFWHASHMQVCAAETGAQAGASEETTTEADEVSQRFILKDCVSLSQSQAQLTLSLEKDDHYSFDIYRASSENGAYMLIDTVNSYYTSWWDLEDGATQGSGVNDKVECIRTSKDYYFVDKTVKFNHRYYYKIFVHGYWSETGEWTNVKSVRSTLSPVMITRGYAASAKKIRLNWYPVEGAKGYAVYRRTTGSWKKIKTIKNKKTVSFTDSTVKSGKTYYYRIRAYRSYQGKTCYGTYGKSYRVKTKTQKIKGNYSAGSVYGPSLSSGKLKEVRQVVQSFKLNYIKSGMSKYQKLLTAYQYLRTTCGYAWKGWQYNGANTAWGALVYGEAQCSGYARGFKALCDALEIPCRYVHANAASANPSHQWNEVKLGGKWYIVDPQGGFFLVSAKTYKKTGMRWDESAYPKCKYDYKK